MIHGGACTVQLQQAGAANQWEVGSYFTSNL